MVETKFLVQFLIHGYTIIFLEVGIKISGLRIFLLQFLADLIDPVGILAIGDRHYGGAVCVIVLDGVFESFFQTQFIAHPASSSSFRLILENGQRLCIVFIIILIDDELDLRIVENTQIGL